MRTIIITGGTSGIGLDIAKSIGTVGHLKSLVRTKVGLYNFENSLSLEDIDNWNY